MVSDWEEFSVRMAESGHEVKAVDLGGYQEENLCSFEDVARRLCAEARAESGPSILVGYSMGGRLALHALLEDAQAWSGAVIVSAHPGLRDEKERILRMASDAEWAARALTSPWAEFLRQWNAQAVLQGEIEIPLGDRALLEDRREAVARSFMAWSLGKQADLRPRLETIEKPLLWLTGGDDERFGELAAEVNSLLPKGEHRSLSGVGHRLPWEAPGAFAAEVGRFLAEVAAP